MSGAEGVARMARRDPRPWYIDRVPSYYGYDGDWHYVGRPGFYGGRYNGGSFVQQGCCWWDEDISFWHRTEMPGKLRMSVFSGEADLV
jgi:hypothetical protein